jgi:integrase
LRWSQVGLARKTGWIAAAEAKGGKDIDVWLSDLAVAVLRCQLGKHAKYVFTYRGRPVGQVNTRAWRGALQRADIDWPRWRDLRHTWASWLVQNGTPLYQSREMGSWKSPEMVRRYAHVARA